MKKLSMLLTPLLILGLIITAVGCGDDDDEDTTTPTQIATATATPAPTATGQGYTGESRTFKIAHINPVTHLTHMQWEYFDERLQYYTDGKVKLEIFPSGSLYASFEMFDALATGALDGAALFDYQMTYAGLYDYLATWINFFWGATMEEAKGHSARFFANTDVVNKLFGTSEPHGVKTVGFMPGSNIQIMIADEKLESMQDLKGLKGFSVGGMTSLYKDYVGATGIALDYSEVMVAFQQGMLDYMTTGPGSVVAARLYEFACCGLMVDMIQVNQYFTFNLNLWNGLSPELQDIIQNKVIPDVKDWTYDNEPEITGDSIQELIDLGMEISYITTEERIEVRDAAWELAKDGDYLAPIDPEILKIADQLRSEPYDQGELIP